MGGLAKWVSCILPHSSTCVFSHWPYAQPACLLGPWPHSRLYRLQAPRDQATGCQKSRLITELLPSLPGALSLHSSIAPLFSSLTLLISHPPTLAGSKLPHRHSEIHNSTSDNTVKLLTFHIFDLFNDFKEDKWIIFCGGMCMRFCHCFGVCACAFAAFNVKTADACVCVYVCGLCEQSLMVKGNKLGEKAGTDILY